jgi:hypothetical protein
MALPIAHGAPFALFNQQRREQEMQIAEKNASAKGGALLRTHFQGSIAVTPSKR